MRRPLCPEGQHDLFAPDIMAQLYAHPAPAAPPRLALPFPRSDEISRERVQQILGVTKTSVLRLLDAGKIFHYQVGEGPLRIRFSSLVDFCNELRFQAGVEPIKLPARGLRPRPEAMLPFPLPDTITIQRVMAELDINKTMALKLAEDGTLSAYRTSEGSCPWRIDVRSLERYMLRLREQATQTSGTVSPLRRPR